MFLWGLTDRGGDTGGAGPRLRRTVRRFHEGPRVSFESERKPDASDLARIPFPRSRWLTPDRGSRRRNVFNQLVAMTAVFGIGAGSWGLWLETRDRLDVRASREKITKACEGLVDPDQVLSLNGGTVRARAGSSDEDSMYDLDNPDNEAALAMLPTNCEIYRVGDPGTSYGHFLLSVRATPSDELAQVVSGWDDPFQMRMYDHADDVTRQADQSVPYPLGDGLLGSYYDNSATVKARCTNDLGDTTSINTLAVARYFENTEVTDHDRRTLAELARTAAARAADKLNCSAELPAVPAELPTPRLTLGNAKSADGTCAWYTDFLGTAERSRGTGERLPDRAQAAPTGARSHEESCLLAVSEKKARSFWPNLTEDERHRVSLQDVVRVAPLWLQTDSFFGDEAGEVKAESFGSDQTTVRPGTAGRNRDSNVWWASSTCAGQPAVHTLSIDYPYDDVIKKQLRSLFKAYVDDVTARRGCTGVKFPQAATFRAD